MMYKIAINRPITTLMLFLALVVFGIMSLKTMPINLFPQIDIPLIKITTYASGDKNFIESRVSKKIENEISAIDGIKKITSYSFNNVSVVIVQFVLEKDIEVAANDVRDRLSRVGLNSPYNVEKIRNSSNTVSLFVSGDDEVWLMKAVDEKIRPFLQRIKGVGDVKTTGFLQPQIRIFLDPLSLNKFSINATDVEIAIKTQNLKAPLGKLESAKNELFLKSSFDAKSLDELAKIRIRDGIFLKDVARIEFSNADKNEMAIMDGKSGVLLEILKVNDANTLDVIKSVKEKISELYVLTDYKFDIKIALDKSELINRHISQVSEDMFLGIILTVIIVFLFLGNFKATIISALAIPVSIVGTFFIIDIFGFDLNRLTLVSLTLGIGIFIDDAIVVIENISKKMQTQNALQASFEGVREIAFSVFVISVVLLCVFVPIAFMDGIVGRYFNSFAMSVSGGIIVSFFVCIMLIPSLASRFLSRDNSLIQNKIDGFFMILQNAYEILLDMVLKFKKSFLLFSFLIFALCISLSLKVGMDFMPVEDNSEFEIFIKAKPGISVLQMSKRADEILKRINADERVEFAYLVVGYTDSNEAFKAKIYTKLKSLQHRKDRQPQIMNEYRKTLKFDDLIVNISAVAIVDTGKSSEPVQLVIMGDDLEKLDEILPKAKAMLQSVNGVVDVGSDSEDKGDELEIYIDKQKAKRLNINEYDVAKTIYGSYGQSLVGVFDSANERYDIVLRFDDKFRQDVASLEALMIKNAFGENFTLSSVASFKVVKNSTVIKRYNKQREITIVANIQNIPLNLVQDHVRKHISQILPNNYEYRLDGFIELMNDTNEAFIFTISLSVILIYMILASLYESFVLPFIIMISMPLAFGGVAVGLYLSGNSFSLFVMVGAILLFGMVGKNAILVVDFANKFANDGFEPNLAVKMAGTRRLKAILMTTFAMIFAMLPLAFSQGSGYEANSPMAIAIISGLISSTLLTLLIVPAMFSSVYKLDKIISRIYKKELV
ncbi:MAG: efflux RND transporter permease subunit [Campylobacter sp.]